MQYPGSAALDAGFRKIQFFCDVTITEALANQTINWAQHSHSFPEDTHEVNLHLKFFERIRTTQIDQRLVRTAHAGADSRGLLPRRFKVVSVLFLTLGLSLRFLLFLEFHGFGKGNFSFAVESFEINNKLKLAGERRADKLEGILRIFPRRD